MDEIKLNTFFVTGKVLRNGRFVDMNGKPVNIDLSKQKIEVLDAVPFYDQHGGPQLGYVTRIYKTDDDEVRFDGFVFDKKIYEYLESNPGVSAELILSDDKITITGIALTDKPAIDDAGVDVVVTLSSREKAVYEYLKKNLEDEEIEDALLRKIAEIVTKYIVNNEYPSPQVKCSMNPTNIDAEKRIEKLENQIEHLERVLEMKEKELEELRRLLEAREQELQQVRLKSKVDTLLSKIKEIEPDFNEEVLLSKPIEAQVSFLETYYEVAKSKGRKAESETLSLSAPKEINAEELELRKIFGLE